MNPIVIKCNGYRKRTDDPSSNFNGDAIAHKDESLPEFRSNPILHGKDLNYDERADSHGPHVVTSAFASQVFLAFLAALHSPVERHPPPKKKVLVNLIFCSRSYFGSFWMYVVRMCEKLYFRRRFTSKGNPFLFWSKWVLRNIITISG